MQIFAVNDGHRSFFYGESVIENGTIHIFTPYNLVFICLPYLQKTAGKFVEIGEILVDDQVDGIKELAENERILKALEAVSDVKGLEISVRGDGKIKDFQMFSMSNYIV